MVLWVLPYAFQSRLLKSLNTRNNMFYTPAVLRLRLTHQLYWRWGLYTLAVLRLKVVHTGCTEAEGCTHRLSWGWGFTHWLSWGWGFTHRLAVLRLRVYTLAVLKLSYRMYFSPGCNRGWNQQTNNKGNRNCFLSSKLFLIKTHPTKNTPGRRMNYFAADYCKDLSNLGRQKPSDRK